MHFICGNRCFYISPQAMDIFHFSSGNIYFSFLQRLFFISLEKNIFFLPRQRPLQISAVFKSHYKTAIFLSNFPNNTWFFYPGNRNFYFSPENWCFLSLFRQELIFNSTQTTVFCYPQTIAVFIYIFHHTTAILYFSPDNGFL